MKKSIFLIIFIFFICETYAQAVLLEQDLSKDSLVKKTGPNLRHYHHFYMSLGFAADQAEKGAEINYGSSNSFDFGYRYKLKICNHYAMGTDFWWGSDGYNMKQANTKLLPDTILNDKEKFTFYNFGLGYYNRINFGKRGNHVGNYLDFGVYGQWTYNLVHYTKNKMTNGNVVEVKTKKLNYYNPLNWGVNARIGFNRYIITASYRMSDYFITRYKYPELPRLTVGVQIGFF